MQSRFHAQTLLALTMFVVPALGQHGEGGSDGEYKPQVNEASDEPLEALAGFQIPEGFAMSLWAAEPLLANPVAFCLDAAGRCFVAETFRVHAGVTDMREHMDWLHDELAAQTVEDRVAFMRKHEGERFEEYSAEHERVRLIVDSDGDGAGDTATVFADGFATPASGIAAGLLARGKDLYYTCIPDLWRLTDADGDGVAEERESFHTGYGVKIALLGHDMHGLRVGPDGRLYYSIGDRGMHVEHPGGTIAMPDRGAVLRCELDGSNLEVFATGLRNPQELVFDDHGNLFTGDNNSDGGDRARWVYVQKGGDSGWRHNYQYVTKPNRRGPWNAERCWEPFHPNQPAYISPPVANFADGPSGLTYYPGAIWGADWDGTFFLCDFRGAPRGSGVYAFQNEAKGAGFALVNDRKFLWDNLVTDVDFGPDGAMWVSDWVASWGMTGKGRMWRLQPEAGLPEVAAEVQRLLAEGMTTRSLDELVALSSHGHREVRQEAYLELAERSLPERNDAALALLRLAADRNGSRFARLSGIWGLSVVARRGAWDAKILMGALLADPDPEIRAQALRVVGDSPYPGALSAVLTAMGAPEARVRAMAAEALGAVGSAMHGPQLVALLERDAESDPWVRTAAIHALERLCPPEQILALAQGPEVHSRVRQCLAVVLRRLESPLIAELLQDPDEAVQAEAARAIHDVPIPSGYQALAERLTAGVPEDHYFQRRCLAALRALHGSEQRNVLAQMLTRQGFAKGVDDEILSYLAEWADPNPVDPIHGAWRPISSGTLEGLESHLAELFPESMGGVFRPGWGELLDAMDLKPESLVLDKLAAWVGPDITGYGTVDGLGDADKPRLQAAMYVMQSRPELAEPLILSSLHHENGLVRSTAFRELAAREPGRAVENLAAVANGEDRQAREFAIRMLGELEAPEAQSALRKMAAAVLEHKEPGWRVAVDLADALQSSDKEGAKVIAAELLAQPELSLTAGGDPGAGRSIFLENAEAQCLKCHVAGGEGSSEVGPALDGVSERLEPSLLLQSVLEPNAVLAEGYENWILALDDGTMLVGRILEETAEEVVVLDAEGETFSVAPAEVEGRRRDVSAMPKGLVDGLSPRQLRDLMAYLRSL